MVQAMNTNTTKLPIMTSPPVNDMGSFNKLLTRIWPLFAVGWLTFVIVGPVAAMLNAADTWAETLATLAWTAALSAAYLWLTLHKPFRIDVSAAERRCHIALLALLAGLVLYVDLANRTGYFWVFICVAISVGVVLPTRAAVWTVVAVTALAAGVEAARSEWEMIRHVPGIAIWGVATIMWRRQILTVDELRSAREDLARLAVTEERLRFARDLHDLLGHSLSLIALKSELAGRLVHTPSERAAVEIADIEHVARRALREVREAVVGYRQPALGDELTGAREMLAAAGIEARIDAATGALPAAIDAVLAWTVREGSTNVIRHSGARSCEIRVVRENGTVRVDVVDDGRGAPAGAGGCGLSGILERVTEAGGWIDTGSRDGGGFALRVGVPLVASRGRTPIALGSNGAAR